MRRLLDTHTVLCVALGDCHQARLGQQRHGGLGRGTAKDTLGPTYRSCS
jgi:hypothetical protein